MENPLVLSERYTDFIVGFMNAAYVPVPLDPRFGKLELYQYGQEFKKNQSFSDEAPSWDIDTYVKTVDLKVKTFEDESEIQKWGIFADAGAEAGILTPESFDEL